MSIQAASPSSNACPVCSEPTMIKVSLPWGGQTRAHKRDCRCEREKKELAQREAAVRREIRRVENLWERWDMLELETDPELPQTFAAWDGAAQPVMDAVYERVYMFARHYALHRPRTGLMLRGERKGTGKSHLLTAAALYIGREHRIPTVSTEFPVLLQKLRPRATGINSEMRVLLWQDVTTVPMLVLNDVARFAPTEWAMEQLFLVLEARIRLTTCMSANQPLTDWAASIDTSRMTEAQGRRMADLVDACVSRMQGACNLVLIPAEARDYQIGRAHV